jgi:hypothetical protein
MATFDSLLKDLLEFGIKLIQTIHEFPTVPAIIPALQEILLDLFDLSSSHAAPGNISSDADMMKANADDNEERDQKTYQCFHLKPEPPFGYSTHTPKRGLFLSILIFADLQYASVQVLRPVLAGSVNS